jgi:hypothetical protein
MAHIMRTSTESALRGVPWRLSRIADKRDRKLGEVRIAAANLKDVALLGVRVRPDMLQIGTQTKALKKGKSRYCWHHCDKQPRLKYRGIKRTWRIMRMSEVKSR